MSFAKYFQLSSKITRDSRLEHFLHKTCKFFNICTRPLNRIEIQVPKEDVYVVRAFLICTFGEIDDSVVVSKYEVIYDCDD